jgi:hypothetical protein
MQNKKPSRKQSQLLILIVAGIIGVGALVCVTAIGLSYVALTRSTPTPGISIQPLAPGMSPSLTPGVNASADNQSQPQPAGSTVAPANRQPDELAAAAKELDDTDIDAMTTPLSQTEAESTSIP